MLWQHAAGRSDRNAIRNRVLGVMRFAHEIDTSPETAQTTDIIGWLACHGDRPEERATNFSYLQSWFSWLCRMEHRADNPMFKLAMMSGGIRDVGAVDQELRLLASVRSTRRSFGGRSTSAVVDQLLDERAAITKVNPARQQL
jgi:site-specific recombinase XerD